MGRTAATLRANASLSSHNSEQDDQDRRAWSDFVRRVKEIAARPEYADLGIMIDADAEIEEITPGEERISSFEVRRHVGRMVQVGGRWYEILGSGGEDSARYGVLIRTPSSHTPGGTALFSVPHDGSHPVRDLPADPAVRAAMAAQGHLLTVPPPGSGD